VSLNFSSKKITFSAAVGASAVVVSLTNNQSASNFFSEGIPSEQAKKVENFYWDLRLTGKSTSSKNPHFSCWFGLPRA